MRYGRILDRPICHESMAQYDRITREDLASMNEDDLRKEVLIPLYRAMGYRDVFLYHGGSGELGKDIVMWRAEGPTSRTNYAVVAKADNITGRVTGKSSAGEVCIQVQQCFGESYYDSVTLAEQHVDHCIVVTSRRIRKEALNALKAALKPSGLDSKITIVNGDRLWGLINLHLPHRAVWQNLMDAHRHLSTLSDDYKTTIETGGDALEITIEPTMSALARGPVPALAARLAFSTTPAGEAARRALADFMRLGTHVRIDGEFIAQFWVPDPIQKIVGPDSRPAALVLEQTPTPFACVDLEIETAQGERAVLKGIDLKTTASGTDQITRDNSHQQLPWFVRCTVDRVERTLALHCEFQWEDVNVRQQLEAAKFGRAMAQGGIFRIRRADTGILLLREQCFPSEFSGGPDDARIQLLEELVAIQDATATALTLPAREILGAEIDLARATLHKLLHGSIEATSGTATLTLTRDEAELVLQHCVPGNDESFVFPDSESVELFDVNISLGPMTASVSKVYQTPSQAAALREALSTTRDGRRIIVEVTIPEGGRAGAQYQCWPDKNR